MRMIRVLLADDEPIIIRGLKKLISWDSLGLEIVGEALDGKELMALIDSCNPDLIISDISMPGYTGIDIIQEIHHSGRPIKVVFISAYQEFAYAQQALQYGAIDYLVKPVNTGQLEEVMARAVSVIRQESKEEQDKAMLNHFKQKNRTVTIEELLDNLTNGNRSTASELARIGGIVPSSFCSVCVIETDEYGASSSRWEERERKLVEFALSNIIREAIEARGEGFLFRKGDRFGILLQHQSLNEPLDRMQDLHGKISGFLKLKVTIGIGKPVEEIELADESYQSALKALSKRFFYGLNSIYAWEEPIEESDLVPAGELESLEHRLAEALKALDIEAVPEMMKGLLQSIRRSSQESKGKAVSEVYNFILRLGQEFEEYGIEVLIQDDPSKSLLETLNEASTYQDLENSLKQVIDRIIEKLGSKNKGKELVLLSQVKAYVEEHYSENITLESIASMVYMNPYYFSSFFKKHTGQNFKNYVTEVRMSQALRLLVETDLMVYEIADRVGYNNARHFSDIFKRKFRKLPQEYKQTQKRL
ncbi:putative response regulatory protein [compost metagenome]